MSSYNDFNQGVINEFRANNGVVGAFAGSSLLLLTTVGAKSGNRHLNPVVTFQDDARWVIIASKAGMPSNPDWYYNIVANPVVTVELAGGKTFQAQATPVTDMTERDRLYAEMVKINPGFAEYERKTTRKIPVVTLERID